MRLDRLNRTGTPYFDFFCRECFSPLIQAVEWRRVARGRWSVLVHCPECMRSSEILMSDDQVHEFLVEADDAARSIVEAAESLDREIFRQSCEIFTQALRADLIRPVDF